MIVLCTLLLPALFWFGCSKKSSGGTIEPTCGNGVLDDDEECDDGPARSDIIPGACRRDCRFAFCGDGVVDPLEECDPGELEEPGCSDTCRVEPGFRCTGSPSVCDCADYFSGPDCRRCVVYVQVDGDSELADGTSWQTAYATVQQAVDVAHQNGPGCEVWVAQGVHYVFKSLPEDTISLRSGVGIYGGFDGSEEDREQRDPRAHPTVLSGYGPYSFPFVVHHVLTAVQTHDATVDGFIVTRGYAGGDGVHSMGGGMIALESDITVARTVFTSNYATIGGGVSVVDGRMRISDCHFARNSASMGGGGLSSSTASIEITGSFFSGNMATQGGGAVLNSQSDLMATNCVFAGNRSDNTTGALGDSQSTTLITHCTFVGNSAANSFGAIAVQDTDFEMVNSIVWGNLPDGISQLGSLQVSYSDVQAWASGGQGNIDQDPVFAVPASSTGSLDERVFDERTVTTTFPAPSAGFVPGALRGLFVNPDTNLDSRWYYIVDNTEDTITVWGEFIVACAGSCLDAYELYDLHLGSTSSPCIDTADDSAEQATPTDIEGNGRVDLWDGAVDIGNPGTEADMGAYEHP